MVSQPIQDGGPTLQLIREIDLHSSVSAGLLRFARVWYRFSRSGRIKPYMGKDSLITVITSSVSIPQTNVRSTNRVHARLKHCMNISQTCPAILKYRNHALILAGTFLLSQQHVAARVGWFDHTDLRVKVLCNVLNERLCKQASQGRR